MSAPRTNLGAHDLGDATLPELLLYAVAGREEEPSLGILLGARDQLGALSALTLASIGQGSATVETAEIAPALEQIVRRLDVAIELIGRSPRTT